MLARRLIIESLESRSMLSAAARDPALWPFDANDPFNTSLGSGAQYVSETSPVFSQNGASLNVSNWSIPIFIAGPNDPVRNFYRSDSPTLIASIRVPASAQPDTQSDGSMVVIDPTTNIAVELWRASKRTNGDWQGSACVKTDLTGPGVFSAYHGIRAGGMSAIAGLIRREELLAGFIPHALAIAVQPTALNRDAPGDNAWIWPASWADGTTNPGGSYGTSGNLYMGSLLAIPPEVNVDALGLSPQALAVAHAMQDYGAYVTETGGGNIIYYAERGAADVVTTNGGELAKLTPYLKVVSNSSAANIGGGGIRRTEPAPPFIENNAAPIVMAGADVSVVLPAVVNLNGSILNDDPITSQWTKVSGPGVVTFGDVAAPITSASFSLAGSYVLRLSASDGTLSASDDVIVTVSGQTPIQVWSIYGTVTTTRNGVTVPVVNNKVHLFSSSGQYLKTVWTNAQGQYSFTGIAVGTYRVGTGEGNYRWQQKTIILESNLSTEWNVRLIRK